MFFRIAVLAILVFSFEAGLMAGPQEDRELHVKICNSSSEDVKKIIDKGADVNSVVDGWTPLMNLTEVLGCGRYAERVKIVKLLLDRGADPMLLPPGKVSSPLYWAVRKEMDNIVELMVPRADLKRDYSGAFAEAIFNGNVRFVEMMLRYGAPVDGVKMPGREDSFVPPLYAAAVKGGDDQIRAAGLLLEKGADINLANGEGETPMMIASSNNNVNFVKLLIDKGANVNAKDDKGRTALNFAEAYRSRETIKILKAAGAVKGKKVIRHPREM
jgi:ankyrin repeat protein